jgi:transglutaminase-like putative cysteine protease
LSCARRRHVSFRWFVLLALWLTDPGLGAASSPADFRTIELTYTTEIGPIEAGRGPVHVFLPLPVQSEHQRIASSDVQATIPGRVEIEETYGNRYWHGYLEESDGAPVEVTARLVVRRRAFQRDSLSDGAGRELTDAEREEFGRFLRANERVVVGHAVLDPILAEVREAAGTSERAAIARAIYDWVVDHVEYKKVGTGWGNGDTFWACSERYGNCTDFHALLISLARTEGIPARFEIGFPVPEGRPEGAIAGYHCWVEFLLPETGWFPVDASEAFKHPDKRELFYGTQPADRVHFTTGRDLRLGADHRDRPLNYFIYPYVEVEGGAYDGRVDRSLSYRKP